MLVCNNCGHQQDSGVFCERCGQKELQALSYSTEDMQQSASFTSTQPNPSLPNHEYPHFVSPTNQAGYEQPIGNPSESSVKKHLNWYWSYCLHLIKILPMHFVKMKTT